MGSLIGPKENIKVVESRASQKARSDDDWTPDWISGSFGGTLKCNNVKCGESVLIMGIMSVEDDVEYDEETGMGNLTFSEELFPVAFIPTINIFTIHLDAPGPIKAAVLEAFKVYWIDIASCGNKIRIVVESIMDDQKILKTYINGGKRTGYSLHKRIELFKSTKPEEADLLMAIKWIGNSSSHTGDILTRDDILDAFEILEYVLTKLYEKDSARLKKLSKAINKKKKPIGIKVSQKQSATL